MNPRIDCLKIFQESIRRSYPKLLLEKFLSSLPPISEIDAPHYALSIGKAAHSMAQAFQGYYKRNVEGVVVTKYGHSSGSIPGFKILECGHPIPDRNSLLAGREIINWIQTVPESAKIILLLSGGASSLVEILPSGIDLEDLQLLNQRLLRSGASVQEMNAVRKCVSRFKGGGLLELAYPRKVITFALSDVIGNDPGSIGSGPSIWDKDNDLANQVIQKYNIELPKPILECLCKIRQSKNPISETSFHIIGSLESTLREAKSISESFGYRTNILTSEWTQPADATGIFLANQCKKLRMGELLLLGGETVVEVKGNGKGGRNQQVALSAAVQLRRSNTAGTVASLATDGTDGPTDACGGIVDRNSVIRMEEAHIHPEEYLEQNNAYFALEASGDLIRTGPTGTNVNDIMFVFGGNS